MRNKNLYLGMAAGLFAAAGWLLMQPSPQASINAQQQQGQKRQQQMSSETLQLPVQQQVLELKVTHPEETRVGESFDYQVEVSNVSDQIMLHDIKLTQTLSDQFEIENVTTGSQQGKANRSGQNQKQAGQNNSNESGRNKSGPRKASQGSQDNRQQQISRETIDGQPTWTISRLKPGESRTIQVTATSDKEGEVQTCLAVTSYTPSLCLTTNFVKPELELVKRAPDEANLCDELEFEYLVENTGSGDLKRFEIKDQLPEGFETDSGEKSLKFAVDGLKAGETRKFVADVRATKAGEFSSRATAMLQTGENVRSQKKTTKIKEGNLAVAIEGPRTHYVDRPLTYNIRVTNTGDAPAPNTRLEFRYSETLSVASVGEPSQSDQAVQASAGDKDRTVGERAYRPDSPKQDQQQDKNRANQQKQRQDRQKQRGSNQQKQNGSKEQAPGQGQNREKQTWEIGTLQSGETRKVTVTVRPHEGGQFTQQAVARFVCAKDTDHEVTQTAQDSLQTEVLSLPALLIGVSDSDDPVAVGKDTVYKILVKNEGTAPDQNIRVTAELPQQLTFGEASGETKAKADGQTVTFEPVKVLKPGESVSWSVRTKATSPGKTALKISVKSDSYSREVTAEEPTRLYKASESSGNESNNSANSSEQSDSEKSGSASRKPQKK